MDEFAAAVSAVVGMYALLFGLRKYSRLGRPNPEPAAVDETALRHVREACQIHERWSVANNIHVACFDLFTILETDEASFCGHVDMFAAVVGPSMQDQSPYVPSSLPAAPRADRFAIRSGEEKTRVMMRAWDYLSDTDRYNSYTTLLTPLIAEQRQALSLDCAAGPWDRAQPPGPGRMAEICGW